MTIEIREILVRANVIDEDQAEDPEPIDVQRLRREILIECEERIREALKREAAR